MKLRPPLRLLAAVLAAAAVSSAAASPFGINGHTPNDAVADRIAEAGIGWVRIDFLWSVVEPERDIYEWAFYDRLVDRLEARGLRILANFHDTPSWATGGPSFSGVPNDPGEVRELLYLASTRYRGRIHAWGLWNEPNLVRFWAGTRQEYIDTILLPGIEALEAGDPGALVTAPDTAHLSNSLWWYWLEDVIAAAGDRLHVVSHHVYPSEHSAQQVTEDLDEDPRYPWEDESVREVLELSGWSGRPFWLTETGVESAVHGSGQQAEFYQTLLDLWFGPQPRARWVDRIFFYEVHDPPPPSSSSWGILSPRPELVRKPAFYAYTDFIAGAVVDDAEIVSVEAPAFLARGETADVRLVLRNTGTTTWRTAEGYALEIGTTGSDWQAEWLPVVGEVSPGETVELIVTVHAPLFEVPTDPSVTTLTARMREGDGDTFGDMYRAEIAASRWDPPEITVHPRSATVLGGWASILQVEVESDTEVSYRWRRNSVELEGGELFNVTDSPLLRIEEVDHRTVGDYDCVITNRVGSVVSAVARVTVGDVPPRRGGTRVRPSGASAKGAELVPIQ